MDDTRKENRTRLGERLLDSIAEPQAKLRPPPLTLSFRLTSPLQVLLLAGTSGVAGAGVLVTLTSSLSTEAPQANSAAAGGSSMHLAAGLTFIVLILAYRWLQRILMKSTSAAVEDAIDHMRTRIAGKIIRLDLRDFEARPREDLQATITNHYDIISESTISVLGGVQSIVLLILTLFYLASLSLVAAGMCVAVLAVSVYAYVSAQEEMRQRMEASASAETAMLGSLGEILNGFKELRLNALKRAAVLEELHSHSARSAHERTIKQAIFSELFVFSNTVAFLLGGAVVFLLPLLVGNVEQQDLAKVVTVVLFIIGPLGSVISAAQQMATARFALKSLRDFEADVDRVLIAPPAMRPTPHFERLDIIGAGYAHQRAGGERNFQVGPIDLSIKRGEVVFLTGGNGSGKTTSMRVVIGLYPAQTGEIRLNGEVLPGDPGSLEAYRHLFGTVFADVHVFRRLYGLDEAQITLVWHYLTRLEIAHKLPADLNSGFDPEALSTGQRKRLATAIMLAEDRPILVFDEWAADQDPEFRAFFYETLLPELRAAGKAVIAITHDDRYFGAADRRYHVEDGRMSLVASA